MRLSLGLVAAMLALGLAASTAQSAKIRPAPRPKTGAAPWPAPKDPMALARKAGLHPEHFEHLTYHVHSHLDIFVNGKKITIPAGIGINISDPAVQNGFLPDGSLGYGGIKFCKKPCISPLHTHADYGLLHTETSTPTPNTLGQFFVEWNVRLTPRCVGGYCKPDNLEFFVNGKRYARDPRKILLVNHTEIAIVIGTPPKTIPSKFPNVPV